MKTKVYPTAKNSLVLKHPIDGPLRAEGSEWEADGFTARMLVDHAITSDPNQAWKSDVAPTPQPEASSAPDLGTIASELAAIETAITGLNAKK